MITRIAQRSAPILQYGSVTDISISLAAINSTNFLCRVSKKPYSYFSNAVLSVSDQHHFCSVTDCFPEKLPYKMHIFYLLSVILTSTQ